MRIADFILNDYVSTRSDRLDEVGFIVGNIGPDCGVPNADWTLFTPSGDISHWRDPDSDYGFDLDAFYRKYLAVKNIHHSFYLGYYVHLLTDMEWREQVFNAKKEEFAREYEQNENFTRVMKRDWYDLDHLFLRENPDFHAFKVFSSIEDFPNAHLEYYPESAFIRQIKYISSFYKNFKGELDREYPYLTKTEMDRFVEKACDNIKAHLIATGLYGG